jgi:hypothetical protein
MGAVGRTRAHHARHLLPRRAPRRPLVKYERARQHPVQDDRASRHRRSFLSLLHTRILTHAGRGRSDGGQVVGFEVVSTDDLDDFGIDEVIRQIRERIGKNPGYLR